MMKNSIQFIIEYRFERVQGTAFFYKSRHEKENKNQYMN